MPRPERAAHPVCTQSDTVRPCANFINVQSQSASRASAADSSGTVAPAPTAPGSTPLPLGNRHMPPVILR